MDYSPRAEATRLLAAGAYLPFMPLFLLGQRRHREVRLIRFHAYQSLGLAVVAGMMLVLGSVVSSLLGDLPGFGFVINLGVGLLFVSALAGAGGIALYAAAMAYQGNYTSVPLLGEWVWSRVNGPDEAERAELAITQRKKRRVKRPAPLDPLDRTDQNPLL